MAHSGSSLRELMSGLQDRPPESPPNEQTEDGMRYELDFLSNLIQNEYPSRIQALETLYKTIRSKEMGEYFDSEDAKWVSEDLEAQRAELDEITTIWNRTSSVYADTYLKLAKTIEMRQAIMNEIDSDTGIFTHRPHLIDKFAQKQAELAQMMDQCREKIRNEQRDIKRRLDDEQRQSEKLFTPVESENRRHHKHSKEKPRKSRPRHRDH